MLAPRRAERKLLFAVLTAERAFAILERMYAAGYGIKPWRADRTGGSPLARLGRKAALVLLVVGLVVLASLGLAVAARGGRPAPVTTVVVQPGDTLWSIASERYPADDVRVRVDDIEQANGLQGPAIQVGQTLVLPG
jgi:nucleoid-associated protein YgaU